MDGEDDGVMDGKVEADIVWFGRYKKSVTIRKPVDERSLFRSEVAVAKVGVSSLCEIFPFVSQTACLHPVEPSACQLHNNTFPAAAGALTRLAYVHFAVGGAGAECTGSRWVGHLLVVPADLTHKVVKSVFDIDARFRGCFDELAAELSCQGFALLFGYHSLLVEIAFVADDNDREVVLVLNAEDLLLECHDFFKGLTRCDGVDQEEAFARSHILFAHGRVFFLSGGIEDIQQSDLIVNDTLLAV